MSLVSDLLVADQASPATPVHLLSVKDAASRIARLPKAARTYLSATGFEPGVGKFALAPDGKGGVIAVLVLDPAADRFGAGRLPLLLPAGAYRLVAPGFSAVQRSECTLAWLLGHYKFGEFRKVDQGQRKLVLPAGVDAGQIAAIAEAVHLGRDLVNRPTNVLNTAELADAALALAKAHGAQARVIVGDDLLKENFPLVHAVGRASASAPRLFDMSWGRADAPKVTLVGKGVCFDTGGLDIKPPASMLLMKKDMGGAASAIAAASILMAAKADIRLRLILPIVENAISGSSYRPGDVLPSRKGISVEIGNTDAEGRLILADALSLADEETPELLVDFATLTGSARVALGPDLPPFYTDNESLSAAIARHAQKVNDPVWRMPLWSPYDAMLESKIADVNHIAGNAFAGSVIAALFLRRFVEKTPAWAHFDVFNWVPSAKPGRPEGADIQASRLIADLVLARYGAR